MPTKSVPAPNTVDSKTEAKIAFQIVTLASLLDRQSTRMFRPHGLSIVDWRILNQLARVGPQANGELCPNAAVDRSLISRRVADLARRRLVTCQPDPGDTRRKIVSITPAGRALYRRVLPCSDRRQSQIEKMLSRQELETFRVVVRKIKEKVVLDLED